jgi:hypothetical protein
MMKTHRRGFQAQKACFELSPLSPIGDINSLHLNGLPLSGEKRQSIVRNKRDMSYLIQSSVSFSTKPEDEVLITAKLSGFE